MQLAIAAALCAPVSAIDLDLNSSASIENAQNIVIQDALSYCPWISNASGATPGMFQDPYYWWEAGVAWNQLIDWAKYTNNDTYNEWIKEALVYQSGTSHDYMTNNQTSVEGNDDEAFWGIAAMNAAEKNFTLPGGGLPPWLYFAQATFNRMASRWDMKSCGGGLRWQIYTWNAGFDYKNMVSNGALFHLAARLSRFTNNASYVDWAEKIWQWAEKTKLLASTNNDANALRVLDGVHVDDGTCSNIAEVEWTYDQGLLLSGCAYLYNYTQNSTWEDRAHRLWRRAKAFFAPMNPSDSQNGYIIYEPGCMLANESIIRCTNDQRCFKGIALTFFGYAIQMCRSFKDPMWPYISASALAAAQSCSGGKDGLTCGLSWLHRGWDGQYGLGEELSALAAFNTLLAPDYVGAYTARDLPDIYKPVTSGDNSEGADDSNSTQPVYGWGGTAGISNDTIAGPGTYSTTTVDKVGVGVLTGGVGVLIMCGSVWLCL